MKFIRGKEPKSSEKNAPDLYEMLTAVEEENIKLKKEKLQLETKLKEYEQQLDDKVQEMEHLKHQFSNTGDLAEYIVSINNVFETAQKTANEYVSSNIGIVESKKKEAAGILAEAQAEKERIIMQAQQEARRIQRINIHTIQTLQTEARKILGNLGKKYDEANRPDDEHQEKERIAI